MSEEQVEELEEEYGFDKPIIQAYLQWLGLPRERLEQVGIQELGKDKVGVFSSAIQTTPWFCSRAVADKRR